MKRIPVAVPLFALLTLAARAPALADEVTLTVVTEAEVRQTITTDIDEAAQGYVQAKASTSSGASSGRRKTYFLFDLTGESPNTNSPAGFTVTLGNTAAPIASGQQRVRLWALDQPYAGFSAALVWDSAQANTTTDLMATNGAFTATPLTGTNHVVPGVGSGSESRYTFPVLPPWGRFLHEGKLILVLAGVPDSAYNGGNPARMRTNAATFTFNSTAGNQAPSLSTIGPQTVTQGGTSPEIPYTVGDDQDPPDWLSCWATTSDEAIVPSGLIQYSPAPFGSNRWLKVTGGVQPGVATVTLHVMDTAGAENQTTFSVTVVPDPMISALPHASTLVNTPTAPLSLTVGSALTDPANLVVTGASGNPMLVPDGGLAFGGAGANRTVTITPASGQTGVAPLTLWVANDPFSNSTAFAVMVLPSPRVVFCEPFDYPDGNLSPLSAGFWSVRVAGNTRVTVAAQQALLRSSGNTWESLLAPLANGPFAPADRPVIYTSLKATWTSLPRDSTGPFVHLADPAGNLLVKVHVVTNGVPEGFFRLGLASGPGNAYTDSTRDLSPGETCHIVTRYDPATGASALWLDAASEASPAVAPPRDAAVAAVVAVGLRNRDGLGTIQVDDLKVARVTKPLATAVRSPAAGVVEIDFAAGVEDDAADFGVDSAATVAGLYTETIATITRLAAGSFRAQLTGAGDSQRFYRVKRLLLAFDF